FRPERFLYDHGLPEFTTSLPLVYGLCLICTQVLARQVPLSYLRPGLHKVQPKVAQDACTAPGISLSFFDGVPRFWVGCAAASSSSIQSSATSVTMFFRVFSSPKIEAQE